MTPNRGRHRKLRRNILHTVVVTALLSGTVTVFDQGLNATPVSAAAPAAPVAASVAVSADGTKVLLSFLQDLSTSVAAKEQFAVTVGTYAAPTVQTVTIPVTNVERTSLRVITLTLSGVIDSNKAPKVVYTAPTIDNNPNAANAALQNLAGEDVGSFTVTSTGTQSLIPAVIFATPPTLQAAGNVIKLTYNIALASSPALPPTTAFSVTTGSGTDNPVTGVTRPTTTTVDLTLRDGVEAGTAVVVSYTAPTVDNALATNFALQGVAGNDAQSFTSVAVTNTASNVPKLNSATIPASGNTIALTFSKTLLTTSLPDKSQFTVTYGGMPVQIASANSTTITLVGTIAKDLPVLVSYTPPTAWTAGTGNIALQDSTTGADVLPFTNFAVNASASTVPYISSTSVASGGNYVYLNYNEVLESSVVKTTSQFVLKVNGVACPITEVRQGTTQRVDIRVDSACIGAGHTVTVSYTPSSYSTTTTPNSVIQNVSGADAPALVNFAITNTSTKDLTLPVLQSAVVSSSGMALALTFSEGLSYPNLTDNRAYDKFSVLVDGVSAGMSSITISARATGLLTLNLSKPIGIGQVVTLSLTNSTGTTGVADTSSNYAANFSTYAVTNSSNADVTAPVLQSIEVPTSGDRLILKYNEAMLNSNFPTVNTTNFGITNGGVAWLPTGISVSGSDVILTGPTTIEAGKTVALTKYLAPTPNAITTNAAIQDTTGNDAASLTNVAVTNKSTLDITSPTWVSATTNTAGDQITLTFNEDISANLAPLAGAFSLATSLGTVPTVTSTSTSGRTVVLDLSTTIQVGATVTFSYTAPNASLINGSGNAAIQDLSGNDAATLTARAVTNASNFDSLPPTVTAVTTNAAGTEITITFNEPLSTANSPTASQFSVANTGGYPAVVSSTNVNGSSIVLTLSSPLSSGTGKTFTYTAPLEDSSTSNSAIQDVVGNDTLTITNRAITNSSTVDQVAPTLVSSVVNTAGTQLTLTFNEALNSTTASPSDFTVMVSGARVTVSSVSIVGSTAVLNLSSTIERSVLVTVAYAASGNDASVADFAIQDSSGNNAVSFGAQSATNSSNFDSTRPTLSLIARPTLASNGTTLTLTYSEDLSAKFPAIADTPFPFAVTVDGNAVTVTGISRPTTTTIQLTLGTAVNAQAVVTVAYTAPSDSSAATNAAVQDVAGNDSSTFSATSVTNNSTQGPITVVSGAVAAAGTAITLTLNKNGSGGQSGLQNGFSFLASGVRVTCSTHSYTGNTFINLSGCAPVIPSGAVVTATWTPGLNGASPFNKDASGVAMTAFSDRLITNNSNVDLTPPTNTAATNAAAGTTLTLVFNEALLTTVNRYPTANQFSITTDGYPTTVSSVSVSGTNVVLTLSTPIGKDATTSVTYTAPTADQTTNNSAIQDAAGNDAATFTRSLSPNSSTVYQGPKLVSSSVNATGNSVLLTFDVPLNSTTALTSAFIVTSNGNPLTISSATVSGSTITLTTSPVVEANDVIRVGYVAPDRVQDVTNSSVQDISGIDAASFALRVVTENNSTLDTQGPSLTTPAPVISSTGAKMTLTFDEALVAPGITPAAFTVTVDGVPVSATAISVVDDTVELTFSPVLGAGRVVTVAYTDPNDSTSIKDAIGNIALSFGAQAVVNSSTVDDTRPALSLIARPSLAANGTTLTLTYNEALASNFAPVSASPFPFTVLSNGVAVPVTAISRPTSTTIQLTLETAIKIGKTVTVSYVAPSDDAATTNTAVQDTTGNDSLSFENSPVTNLSDQGIGITAVVVAENGANVTLSYNKSAPSPPGFSSLQWFVDGDPVTLTLSGSNNNNGIISYNFSPTIYKDSVVTMSYTAPNEDLQTVSSVTNFPVTNNSTLEPERVIPVFTSAIVNPTGTTLTLNYNETLNPKTALPVDFEITINGEIFNPADVTIVGSSVALSVGRTITSSDLVTVTYKAPAPSTTKNFAIQDTVGNDAVALTNQSVTNGSTSGPDLTGPTASRVSVNGSSVTVTLNEFLNSTTAGANSFTVFVGNEAVTPTNVTVNGQTVVLTLPNSVPAGTIVAVSYTAPTPADSGTANAALQDSLGNDAASFNVSTQSTGTNWEWVGGTPSQSCPGSGSAYPNSSKSKLLPNGVTYTVAVTGDYLCIDFATESLSERGGKAGDFQSVGLVTEPGLKMWTSNNGCTATELIGRCDNRGVMTISFSKPVTNPVVSFAGWGGGNNGAGWSEMKLLTPGATLTALAGTNIAISQNGTVVGNVDGTVPAIYCHRTSGYGANSQAVCGSVQVQGVYTSVSFQVNFEYAASNTGSDGGNEDAWNLTASIPEDFGMVPTSYDSPVASHALGSLKLGSVVTADNPSSLYATSNGDAVNPGAEIKAGVKNISNGDVVVDDGVPQAFWNGIIDNRTGQTFTVPVSLAGVEATASLCAWIDFNRDGVFTGGERACATNPTVGQTSANISWTIPNDVVAGLTYARVRLSYDVLPLPSGKVGSGEVEDYSLKILASAVPQAIADYSTDGLDKNQTIEILSNDQFQDGYPAAAGQLFLCQVDNPATSGINETQTPNSCSATSVVVPGQGTYTLNTSTGVVTFDPLPNFVGTATPLKYQVTDTYESGRTTDSTINPVVIPAPVANPDISLGDYDVDQTIIPLPNDVPGSSNYPLVSSTLRLCQVDDPATTGVNEAQTPNNCTVAANGTVTIPGEGTYTVNNDGSVTFNPLPTFTGTVTVPIKYQVQDTLSQFANSTITPTVGEPPQIVAVNDTSVGLYDAIQRINILENDTPGESSDALQASTLKLCQVDNPATTGVNEAQTPNNCTVSVVSIPGEGTYTVNSDGSVSFDPLPTFTGTVVTPVRYQVTDNFNRIVNATITPTVGEPPAPSALPETSFGPYNKSQSTVPLSNETPGSSAFPLSQSALKLCAVDEAVTPLTNEAESPNDCSATAVTIPGEGTYAYDAVTGKITFTPVAAFTGEATPVVYQTNDSLNRFVDSTYTPTVDMPPPPAADDETSVGAFNTAQAPIDVLLGDTPGDPAAPLDPATLRLCDPSTSPAQTGAACDQTLVTTVDGTYEIVDGKVVFTPATDFHGDATPIDYIVKDSLGQVAQGTISPTVNKPAPPTADPETKSVLPGDSISFTPVTGDGGLASGTDLDPASVCLVADAKTTPSTGCVTSLTTADGTWSVDPATGVISYASTGSTPGNQQPVTYRVTDVAGQSATDTLTPVIPPPPAADDETSVGAFNTAQAPIDVLLGDTPGDPAAPLDPATLRLCDPSTSPAQTGAACDQTLVTTVDGTYEIVDGKVVFTPATDFHGDATPIDYIVKDSLGQVAQGTISPTVIGLPTANPDTSFGPQGVAQPRNVVTNNAGTSDAAASGTNLVASTVTLSCDSAPNCTRNVNGTVTIAGQGTYSAAAANGTVVFTPLPDFTGEATPVTYTVSDAFGQSATTTYTPTVIPAPVAINDTSTNGLDKNQLIDVLDNDTVPENPAGDPLNPASVKLCGISPVQTPASCNKLTVTTADGTYTVNPTTGVVTFDPLPTFTGTVTVPVKYQVSDTGTTPQTTSALITPTVIPGPTAQNDTSSGPMNTPQTKSLVANDSAPSGATLEVSTVKLCAVANPSATPPVTAEVAPNCTKTSVDVPGVGNYSVDSTGMMTFTPVTGYSGSPTALSYTVADNFGVKAKATYTPKVIPPPTVVPDTSTGPWDTNQIRNVVTNSVNTGDSAATGATLVAGSIRLCAPTDTAPNCSIDASGSVEIPNQGTYTVNPTTNEITFDPLPTWTGQATAVRYSVTDDLGQKSSTTYTPTVTVPPVPTSTPDTITLISGSSKAFSSIYNASTGDSDPALATKGTGGPDLTNSSACLLTPGTSVCDPDGIVTIAGQGTYTLDPDTGIVTYAADASATAGAKTAVNYKITDGLGRSITNTLTPTITPRPVANPDSSTGVQGAIQTLSPVGNDRPGGGASTELYPDTRAQIPSGIFLCAANEPPPNCAASSVTVTDPVSGDVLGMLTVAATGLVTFTPEPDFIGTTPPIGYQLPDNLGQMAYSTITITVVPPPAPTATIDTGSAAYNRPVTLKPWMNDAAGNVPAGSSFQAPRLIATSIKLCDDNSTFIAMVTTPDCTATKIQTVEGTYEVSATTGEVVFTPVDGFTGTVNYPPTYQIWNNWTGPGGAKSATALLVPTISPPGAPAATVDVTKTKPGTSVVLNPVANDKPGTAALDPTSIRLCGAGEISPACAQMEVTTLDGSYVVDPGSGKVTFTPRAGFIGRATIPYIISDGLGMMANANLIITVEDTAVAPTPDKKPGLAQTGGHRPDLLLLLGMLAILGAGVLRITPRKR